MSLIQIAGHNHEDNAPDSHPPHCLCLIPCLRNHASPQPKRGPEKQQEEDRPDNSRLGQVTEHRIVEAEPLGVNISRTKSHLRQDITESSLLGKTHAKEGMLTEHLKSRFPEEYPHLRSRERVTLLC